MMVYTSGKCNRCGKDTDTLAYYGDDGRLYGGNCDCGGELEVTGDYDSSQ